MRSLLIMSAPLLMLGGLSACDDYGPHPAGWGYYDAAPYDGWYDGYYGDIYDGYWGDDGFFYYRPTGNDREFRRGDGDHFRHDQAQPGGNFRHLQGTFAPQKGYSMPHFHQSGRR